MKITIHRGTNQIEGCVTEYEQDGWHLFVDYGEQLVGVANVSPSIQIDGLTHGDVTKSALLITHHHADHIGKIGELPEDLPIFIGAVAKEIQIKLSEHLQYVDGINALILKRIKKALTFEPGYAFEFGPLNIMPIMMDHSAFDAYAFKISADGLSVFHTGDFRTHGFRSKKLPVVINKYVKVVDYVVCEATNVTSPEITNKPEFELLKEFETAFKKNKYNIVYLSSTNIDRLFAIYHAALSAGRPFYVDAYQKHIMDSVINRDRLWGKSRLYKYKEYDPIVLHREGHEFRVNDKFIDFASEKGYVLIARANPRFDNLIKQLPGEPKVKYLSMWKGYVDPTNPAYNSHLADSLGTAYNYIHTSGHCDMTSLRKLFSMLYPKAIIPIHTDDPNAFANLFADRWPVVLLSDGECINMISYKYFDPYYGYVDTVEAPAEDVKEISNPEHLKWYALESKCIGYFSMEEDAYYMLKRVRYAPERLLGYTIIAEEDMEVFYSWVYDNEFKPLHNFVFSGHKGNDALRTIEFKAGEKALAAITPKYNVIVPCEVTKDTVVKKPTDKVPIRCFVRVADKWNKMVGRRSIPAIQLYPYQEFKL